MVIKRELVNESDLSHLTDSLSIAHWKLVSDVRYLFFCIYKTAMTYIDTFTYLLLLTAYFSGNPVHSTLYTCTYFFS